VHFQQVVNSRFEFGLYEPKLFIDLIPEYFSEDCDVVVAAGILLDA
jgi:hypothetical protein